MSAPLDRPSLRARARAAAPWLGVAVVALVHTGLAADPAAWAGSGDEPKYLALARSAPAHRLYDDRLYAIHPPLHAWLIAALAAPLGLSLPTAGAALAGLCTLAVALLCLAGARGLTGSSAAGLAAGLLFATSRLAVHCGSGVYREPLQAALLLALLALLGPRPDGGARAGPSRVAGAALVGLALGLTWDLFLLLLPLLALAALLRAAPRPLLLAAAVGLALGWGGWAALRLRALKQEPEYPAGIDGTREDTTRLGLGAWNPNLLPRTARHNAYHWQPAPSPLAALEAAAPAWPAPAGPFLDVTSGPPPLARRLGGVGLGLLALLGGATLLRRLDPAQRRPVGLALLGLGGLSLPGLMGYQVRYAYLLAPALAVAAAGGVAWLEARSGRARLVTGLVLALGGASSLAWAVAHPYAAWTRPRVCEGHGVAAWLEATPLPGDEAVAAPVGLTPDLCWLRPGQRVVTLPPDGVGLEGLLAARAVRLVVVPHELTPWVRPGATREQVEEATGLAALRAVHAAAQAAGPQGRAAGPLRHLGVVLEAEATDRPRARAFDLLWREAPGSPAPPPCGVWLAPGACAPLLRLHAAGGLSPETERLLRAAAPALEARAREPGQEGQAAGALLARLR